MTRQLNTWLNFEPASADNFEHPVGPSQTVPDMTLSIRELIQKHTVNNLIGVSIREPVYNGDGYIPDPARMDLSEKEAYADYMGEEKQRLESEHAELQKTRKEREREQKKQSRKELLDELKQQTKNGEEGTDA